MWLKDLEGSGGLFLVAVFLTEALEPKIRFL